ncbi:MAG: metallophosphoesterase family protein [Planctomycetes bacterium]|nr:metallophosphoesterase family protein [Planctomycetota bacterium]
MRLSGLRRASFLVVAAAACAVFTGSTARGHDPAFDDEPPPRVLDAVLYRPSAMPDRVVLSWTGDAATTRAVTWRTSTDVERAYAQIAPADAGPRFKEQARRLDAVTHAFKSDLSKCHVHAVEFKDLQPATKYAYRVGDGVNFSEWFQFRTAAVSPEPFSFVYFGDAQNDIRSMWSRVIREAWSDVPRAAFMLHAGDLVTTAESDAQWGEWFSAGGWLNGMIPVVATPGNHEYLSVKQPDGSKTVRLSRHWTAQFTFPANGPPGLEETAYYLDYHDLRVISLNSNERQEEQAAWLDKVLAASDRTWTVITFHHPIFSVAKERDNPSLRNVWKPTFDRHPVDLVLNGHDHTYGRTGPIGPEANVSTGTSWRSGSAGTVYVVSVSGPKMYEVERNPRAELRRVAEDTQLYQIISIDGPVLRYEARTAIGDVYDAFTLKKRPGAPNEMIEQVPSVPERRRKPAE